MVETQVVVIAENEHTVEIEIGEALNDAMVIFVIS